MSFYICFHYFSLCRWTWTKNLHLLHFRKFIFYYLSITTSLFFYSFPAWTRAPRSHLLHFTAVQTPTLCFISLLLFPGKHECLLAFRATADDAGKWKPAPPPGVGAAAPNYLIRRERHLAPSPLLTAISSLFPFRRWHAKGAKRRWAVAFLDLAA